MIKITAIEIADLLGAILKGDAEVLVTGVAAIDLASDKDLSFINSSKELHYLETTKAKVILLSQDCGELKTSKTLLLVKNPKLAFAKVLELVKRPEELKPGIDSRSWIEKGAEVHPTSMIYPFVTVRSGAKIGERVILHPGAYVGHDVVVEDDCILYPQVTVFPRTKIGKNVLIHAGAVVGDDGFGYVWDGKKHYKVPQVGNVVIEDDVEIGSNTCIDRGAIDETRVGEGTKIDNLVQVGHNNKIGKHCILCGQAALSGSVHIGDGALLGGGVGIVDNIKIGSMSQIGMCSFVMSDISPNSKSFGYPAMNGKDYMRIIAYWKKLPEMHKEIKELKNEIKKLKNEKLPPQK